MIGPTRAVGVRRVRFLLGFSLIVTLTGAGTALAQTGPPCPRGSGLLTSATLGGDIRDGQGVGVANLGNTPADIERVWGAPENCLPQRQGYSYNYFLTGDGGQTGWLVVVIFMDGKATDMVVSAIPHARGPGPTIQTARGVAIFATEDEMRRKYGTPGATVEPATDGIAFLPSRGLVGGIFVFRPGTMPPGLRP
jgi:hypothetical protein